MDNLKFDVSKLNLQVLNPVVNASPDIYINAGCITFTKRAVEELGYPGHVQYSIDPEQKVFAVKPCRSVDKGAASFSKPRGEQTATVSCGNKNILEPVRELMKEVWDDRNRYKVTGFLTESKMMIFVLSEGVECVFRPQASEKS